MHRPTSRVRTRTIYIILIVILLLCEFTIFQYHSYMPTLLRLEQRSVMDQRTDNDSSSETSYTFENIHTKVRYVGFRVEGDEALYTIKIYVKSDSYSRAYRLICEDRIYPSMTEDFYYPIYMTENTQAIRLDITKPSSGTTLTLKDFHINQTTPIRFSLTRFIFLALVALFLLILWRYRLWRRDDRPGSLPSLLFVLLAICICVFSSITLLSWTSKELVREYPTDSALPTVDPYIQQFDAFQKGQLHLDLPVDDKLLQLHNPYDISERIHENVSYHWDRAFYEGKYYSYFGLAPLFTVYYPVYYLTGSLPNTEMVCFFFILVHILFFIPLLRKLAHLFCRNVNSVLLFLGSLAAVFGSSVLMIQTVGDFYCVPLTASMCFLTMFFYFGVTGYLRPKTRTFIAAGISLAMIAASRPSLGLYALILVPLFLCILRDKNMSCSDKIRHVTGFTAPLLLLLFGILSFNYARFGSLTEFGQSYQLTVSDISSNQFFFADIFPAIYHYFFQPMNRGAKFPFFFPRYESVTSYGKYVFSSPTFGVFSMPTTWALTCIPAVFPKKDEKHRVAKIAFLLGIPILSVILCVFNYALAGITLRYLSDILPMLSLLAVLVILRMVQRFPPQTFSYKCFYVISCLLFTATILIGFFLLFSVAPEPILKKSPDIYYRFQSIFSK